MAGAAPLGEQLTTDPPQLTTDTSDSRGTNATVAVRSDSSGTIAYSRQSVAITRDSSGTDYAFSEETLAVRGDSNGTDSTVAPP